MIVKKPNKPVLVRNVITDTVIEFSGVNLAAIRLKVSTKTVLDRVKSRGQKLFEGKYQFKLKSDTTDWKVYTPDEIKNYSSYTHSRVVLVEDVETQKVIRFKSIAECAMTFDMSAEGMRSRLYNNADKIFNNQRFRLES